MNYYRFLFYYVYQGYVNKDEKNLAGVYALCLMTLVFFSNLMSFFIIVFLLILKIDGTIMNGLIGGILFIIILSANYIYFYRKKGKEKAIAAFSQAAQNTSKLKTAMLIYILSSIILMFASLYFYINYA